jgi:N-acetylmuramoyl-L-alanine amidase
MKPRQIKTIITLALLLGAASLPAEPAQAGGIQNAKVVATSLNVRSEPSMDAPIVGSLPYGTLVSISQESYGWAKISTGRTSGWVAGYYLKKGDEPGTKGTAGSVRPAQPASVSKRGTVLADALRLRKGPGVEHPILQVLPQGTALEITGQQQDWLRVRTPAGATGWVLGSYVGTGTNAPRTEQNSSAQGIGANVNRTPGLKGKVIVIDPGHGGIDAGALGTKYGTQEKTVNLQTARYVADKLRQLGARVTMTRTGEGDSPALFQRVALSETLGADAFISIHYNSSPKPASGTLTFFYQEKKDLPLAQAIEARLRDLYGMKSNGLSFGDYHVLRENDRPAVLVELGFLTNPRDEAMIRTADYQRRAAEAIVAGLKDYFGG